MKTNPSEKTAQDIVRRGYVRRLLPDETGGYVASILEFPGCIAEGDTAEEALANLDKAAIAWVEAALESGYPIREPFDFGGHSGKIALRMPRMLHKQAAELAELEGCSLNQLLVTAISYYVSGKTLLSCMTAPLSSIRIDRVYVTNFNPTPAVNMDTLELMGNSRPITLALPIKSAWTDQHQVAVLPGQISSHKEAAHG